jgi:hypothetical protein
LAGVTSEIGIKQSLLLGATSSLQKAFNPAYSGATTHKVVQEVVRSDEHRALGGIFSDVSRIDKKEKKERGILEIGMLPELEVLLNTDLDCMSNILQDEKIKNIGLMALLRFFISSSKGDRGLVGGKNAAVLDFSKIFAVPRNTPGGRKDEFVSVVFLSLKPVGGANANFEEALEGGGRLFKNLVVGIAQVKDGSIKNAQFSFCGMFIAFNPKMVITRLFSSAEVHLCFRLPLSCICRDTWKGEVVFLFGYQNQVELV